MKNPSQLMLAPFREDVTPHKIHRTFQDYTDVGWERGIHWIGRELPKSANAKTEFICQYGHRFISTYGRIKYGVGCAKCSGKRRLTASDYHELANLRGFEWRGDVIPKTNKHNSTWYCPKCCHEWQVTYRNLQAGSNCPNCVGIINGHLVSKVQRKLHVLIGGILNPRIGKYSVDISIEVYGMIVAVEYDGWYWHTRNDSYENERDIFIISNGYRIVHIRGRNLLPTQDQLAVAYDKLRLGDNVAYIILDDWQLAERTNT